MAEIFPRWMNRLPRYLVTASAAFAALAVFVVGYAFSPAYTDVGYMPRQPIPFSHRLHAGELSVDCRYCHASVEISPSASLPPSRTCMNCHSLVSRDRAVLAPLRESVETGEPTRWIRVHRLPDYAYFDHSVHVAARLDCSDCHGNVAAMEEVRQVEPLSMRWCLDCHRDPPETAAVRSGPTDCTACHR